MRCINRTFAVVGMDEKFHRMIESGTDFPETVKRVPKPSEVWVIDSEKHFSEWGSEECEFVRDGKPGEEKIVDGCQIIFRAAVRFN